MREKEYTPLMDIESVIPMLNKIAIFGGIKEEQLQRVFIFLQEVSYEKDELIFEEGGSPTHIYLVKKGKVKIFAREADRVYDVMILGPGQCFGETSVIGVLPHSASAVAVEDTELIVLSREALHAIFEADKELFSYLILNIAREVCRLLNKADETLFHYALKSSR
ncbi:cyclic nucleotide-binding domain-containing protein [bacterium]|nr:cyclic nucleotide-binding domain-containing protein [bacterium]